jgi:hypothetical protein
MARGVHHEAHRDHEGFWGRITRAGVGHGMTRKITERGGRGWRALQVSRQDAKFAKGLARGGLTRSCEGTKVF